MILCISHDIKHASPFAMACPFNKNQSKACMGASHCTEGQWALLLWEGNLVKFASVVKLAVFGCDIQVTALAALNVYGDACIL